MTRIVSLDGVSLNDGTYRSFFVRSYGFGPRKALFVGQADDRPALSAISVEPRSLPPLQVVIEDAPDVEVARRALHALFFQVDRTAKRLLVADADGSNQRYWDVVVEAFDQVPATGGTAFVATMRAVDDNALRGLTPITESKTVTSSPSELVFDNSGDIDAFPVISITPNTPKTGTWRYRRFVRLRWRSPEGASKYPVDVLNGLDTTTLVSGGKMQADGRDLRVRVNGVLVEPYVAAPNTASTRAWVALDFAPYPDLTLATAIAGSGVVTAIEVQEGTDIASYPDRGLLVIDNEIFEYSSRNTVLRRFEGIVRAARGSSMAAHSAGATCWLCQHDLWVLYGHSGALPPLAPSQLNRPAFSLTASTNGQWVYNSDGNMGDNVGYRLAGWRFNRTYGPSTGVQTHTGNEGANADPWQVIGLNYDAARAGGVPATGEWQLIVPAGVSGITMSGKRYRSMFMSMMTRLYVRRPVPAWAEMYEAVGPPGSYDAWDNFSVSLTPPVEERFTEISLLMYIISAADPNMRARIEASTITVTLQSGVLTSLLPENEIYSLDARITNLATGDAIALQYEMPLGGTMIVDTEVRTVTVGGSAGAFSALSMRGSSRSEWLPLVRGPNTLRYEESGVTSVGWQVQARPRYIY